MWAMAGVMGPASWISLLQVMEDSSVWMSKLLCLFPYIHRLFDLRVTKP